VAPKSLGTTGLKASSSHTEAKATQFEKAGGEQEERNLSVYGSHAAGNDDITKLERITT
jgi:hypothetical protein